MALRLHNLLMKSYSSSTTKYLLKDLLLDFLTFPLWWYSRGLVLAARHFLRRLKIGLQFTGLKVWLLNLTKPMFGDVTWQGRLIGLTMRFIFLILRFLLMVIWLIFSLIILLLYLGLPPLIIYMLIQQLS